MVRVILLTVYWFHPLVWVMAFLSRRDCEQACDEAAIRALGEEERLAYGRTLVGLMAAGRPSDLVCGATTITDSKRGIKERVKRIAQRPQTRAAAAFLLAACVALGAAFTFTESPTHARACAMLKSNPPVSAYSFHYIDGIQTYTALSGEQMQKAAGLFLSIRNTEENPTYAAEGTSEWQLHFNFSGHCRPCGRKAGHFHRVFRDVLHAGACPARATTARLILSGCRRYHPAIPYIDRPAPCRLGRGFPGCRPI